jgi:hypothetical protein
MEIDYISHLMMVRTVHFSSYFGTSARRLLESIYQQPQEETNHLLTRLKYGTADSGLLCTVHEDVRTEVIYCSHLLKDPNRNYGENNRALQV